MRFLVIVNPAARRGAASTVDADLGRALRLRQIDFEIHRTARRGHAREIMREHAARFAGIIVCGGDGTVHEVIQELDLERHCLGVLPRGTGNDFAWMNRIPRDLDAAVARIAAGNARRIDVGLWSGRRFHNSIGVGFEGRVNFESQHIRRVRGAALYLVAVARTLSQLQSHEMHIAWDGGHWDGEVFMASVCIGQRVGGAFRLAPDARNDDGLLDLCFAGKLGLGGVLRLLPRTFRGSHVGARTVRMQRSPYVRIVIPDGAPVHVDGEFIDLRVRELDLRLLPGALRLL